MPGINAAVVADNTVLYGTDQGDTLTASGSGDSIFGAGGGDIISAAGARGSAYLDGGRDDSGSPYSLGQAPGTIYGGAFDDHISSPLASPRSWRTR